MKNKSFICLSIVICLLLCLAGCGEKNPVDPSDHTSVISSDSAAETKSVKATFAGMPAIDTPMVQVYPGDGTLLFHFISPGMDSSESTLVLYSLTEDKMLARVDAGNGVFSVGPNSKDGFSLFDASKAEGNYYTGNGSTEKTVSVSCIDGGVGFIAPGGEKKKMLVSESQSGSLYLVTPDGKQKTKVDLPVGAYEMIGSTNGSFVVTYNAQSVYLIRQDASTQKIFSSGNLQKINGDYAAGRIGDHFAFVPLGEGDCLFAKAQDTEETLLCAGSGVFLTSSVKGAETTLRLYRMNKLKTAEFTLNAPVEAAAVIPGGQIAAVCRDEKGFTYQLLDPASWQEKDLSSENDLSAVLGSVSLPEIGNRDETDAYAKEVLEKYNVRFLYESCELVDEMQNVGMEAKLSDDRGRILAVQKHLTDCFAFLPDEVWKNIGGDLPFLVLLCEEIPGNAGGICFEFGNYNCIFIEIGGNDSYYTNTFFHEVGHAIDNRVMKTHPELIAEWTALTPGSVLKAVENDTADGKNALTVEFTPDDKSGNVCYVSAYARKNPEEDRAEILAKFHNAVYQNNDTALFSHEVLKKKAKHWAKMLRAAFPLKEGTVLPFDSL